MLFELAINDQLILKLLFDDFKLFLLFHILYLSVFKLVAYFKS